MTPQAATKSSGEGVVVWVLFLAAVALAVVVARRPRQRETPAAPQDPLSLVPAGPRLLITADVAVLGKLAGAEVLRAGGDKLLGLRELCGFEPLLQVERAAFAMPSGAAEGQGSDFALIAQTSLDAEPGLRCAELVIQKRGGTPSRTRLGQFIAVRDVKKPLGEVALRSDGMFVLSGGRYFRDVMDAAAGASRSDDQARVRSDLHRKLRERLGSAQLTITLLPSGLVSLAGGLGAFGLSLQLRDGLMLRGFVSCMSPSACEQARQLVEATKTELAAQPELAQLASLGVTQQDDGLAVVGRLPRQALVPLLQQLLTP